MYCKKFERTINFAPTEKCKRFSYVAFEALIGNVKPLLLTLWKDADEYLNNRQIKYFAILFYSVFVSSVLIIELF